MSVEVKPDLSDRDRLHHMTDRELLMEQLRSAQATASSMAALRTMAAAMSVALLLGLAAIAGTLFFIASLLRYPVPPGY